MLKLDIFLKMYIVPVILSFYLFLYCLKNQSIIPTLVSISKLIVNTPSNYLVSLIEPSRVSSSGQTFLEYSQQLSNYLCVWSQRTLMYLYISCPNIFISQRLFSPQIFFSRERKYPISAHTLHFSSGTLLTRQKAASLIGWVKSPVEFL